MNKHQTILPEGWPVPKGYSNAILAVEGQTLFTAGVIGWNSDEIFESQDLMPQFKQVLLSIVEIVREAGGQPTDICKMTCFCTTKTEYLASRKELGAIWHEIMGKHYPCMSMIFVDALLENSAKIEIEATAVIICE